MAAKIIRFFPRYLRKEASTSSSNVEQRRQMPGYFAIFEVLAQGYL